MAKKDIYSEQITVDGYLYDYHVSHTHIVIRRATGAEGEKRGWAHDQKFSIKDSISAQAAWKELYDWRYVTAVAVVEKGKCDTMSHLQPLAAQINEKYERFQTVEKEATMLMLEIGLATEYVKEQLPHGQLQKWEKNNLTISHRHAQRFRQLAQVFIKANQLKNDEMFLLCDPANSKEALGDKLRQMAFDFLGDQTQAELFEQYKIKYQEPKKLGGARSSEKEPKLSLADKKRLATELIEGLQNDIQRQCIDDKTRKLHLLAPTQLKSLEADLVSALLNVRELLKSN